MKPSIGTMDQAKTNDVDLDLELPKKLRGGDCCSEGWKLFWVVVGVIAVLLVLAVVGVVIFLAIYFDWGSCSHTCYDPVYKRTYCC